MTRGAVKPQRLATVALLTPAVRNTRFARPPHFVATGCPIGLTQAILRPPGCLTAWPSDMGFEVFRTWALQTRYEAEAYTGSGHR